MTDSPLLKLQQLPTANYEMVAAEYYDPIQHPTCANFRKASETILSRWLSQAREQVAEVGCGRSIVGEIMSRFTSDLSALTLIDSSLTMLRYSLRFEAYGAKLMLSDAEDLKLNDHSVDVLIASLGDPFNSELFWHQVQRVVRPSGRVVFTTPSFEWSSSFRSSMNHPTDVAEFITRAGSRLYLPSFIVPEEEQIHLLTGMGLKVAAVEHVTLVDLGVVQLSSKLRGMRDGNPIVTGYICST